ncbi:receptor-type tyrosine-protein phosphatase eta [Tachysurus fulvidraco]|uniref:receptor-type tyrosine-protein phosphatase eta n=1 Tax=Tachysurus fulvidraco TaxID=1234273 RepID=UPI001FEF318C|nr:receptor-type tyrosine-protein phosphatase eta [Tachysurus fulvidraco]
MLLLGSLLLVAVSVICVEKEYFYKSSPATWDDARSRCQVCYKDLTTITPQNAEAIGLNLTSDYWIGLRQNMSGLKLWSRWANGEPVLYQNWYPGHPVLKKKPEPQPTCPPPPPTINNTKPEAMQCPAFTQLCECLNSSSGYDDPSNFDPFNTTNSTVNMWCPALAKLCDCLNSHEENQTSPTESTTPVPTTLASTRPSTLPSTFLFTLPNTSSPASTISSDLESELELEYIEDSCVVLLSFGMWQEKQCNHLLPYICYDEIFYGDVQISNVTQSGAFLSWSEAGVNISRYIVVINGNQTANVTNGTSYPITYRDPGYLYRVQVIPEKCGRNLNAQNISFYTLPEEIRNLSKVSVGTNNIELYWNESRGTNVSYLVNIQQGNLYKDCPNTIQKTCNITKLEPGQKYNFTVKAVVNGTIFGTPDYIIACTKPSKVMNLTSSNDDSLTITAMWDSPDKNSLQYTYNITLDNMHYNSSFKNLTIPFLSPGTKYTLNVSAFVPDCSEDGETVSISAYTTPMSVSNLQLTSNSDSISATWNKPNGSFAWFNVTLSSSMTEDNSLTSVNTSYLNYTFSSLKTAALYNVSVVTYVEKDLNPSKAVIASIFTRPSSPGKATVENINYTAVSLSWEIPANSKGVKNINYSVVYVSDFWNEKGKRNVIGDTSVIIGGLRSGSKYKYNITILAGDLESLPSETSGITKTVNRTLTLALLCSSSTPLYCMNSTYMKKVLDELRENIRCKFKDNISWTLTLH